MEGDQCSVDVSRKAGRWQLALGLLVEMAACTVRQSTITLSAAASAWRKMNTVHADTTNFGDGQRRWESGTMAAGTGAAGGDGCEHTATQHKHFHRCDHRLREAWLMVVRSGSVGADGCEHGAT